MPERSGYAHGVPNWVDLATTDVEAAKAFYGAVLGWEYEHRATDQGSDYVLARRGAHKVAGMMTQAPEQVQMGIPPMWVTYVNVDSVDEIVAEVAAAGGQVVMPGMDVMDQGRMAVIADPTGAVVGVWQKGEHFGAELVNEHGALCWNELETPDVDAAKAFFGSVFGWGVEAMDMGDGNEYTVWTVDGDGVGGAMPPPMEGIPPHWSAVFAVDDVDAAAAAVDEAGGQVIVEPFDMMVGRLAVVADGQGAAFQLLQMADQAQ